jgi:hypothetical protein
MGAVSELSHALCKRKVVLGQEKSVGVLVVGVDEIVGPDQVVQDHIFDLVINTVPRFVLGDVRQRRRPLVLLAPEKLDDVV